MKQIIIKRLISRFRRSRVLQIRRGREFKGFFGGCSWRSENNFIFQEFNYFIVSLFKFFLQISKLLFQFDILYWELLIPADFLLDFLFIVFLLILQSLVFHISGTCMPVAKWVIELNVGLLSIIFLVHDWRMTYFVYLFGREDVMFNYISGYNVAVLFYVLDTLGLNLRYKIHQLDVLLSHVLIGMF